MSDQATNLGAATLPIYQGLLDDVDQGTRDTVIAQQGEGHEPRQVRPVDEGQQSRRHS